jgi:hypothetical protein
LIECNEHGRKIENCTKEEYAQYGDILCKWNNHMHLDTFSHHFAPYCEEGNNFLNKTVTSDETWVHHNQAEKHAMEASVTSCKEIRVATISRQVVVDRIVEFSRAYSWNLPGMWNNCHKCNLP